MPPDKLFSSKKVIKGDIIDKEIEVYMDHATERGWEVHSIQHSIISNGEGGVMVNVLFQRPFNNSSVIDENQNL